MIVLEEETASTCHKYQISQSSQTRQQSQQVILWEAHRPTYALCDSDGRAESCQQLISRGTRGEVPGEICTENTALTLLPLLFSLFLVEGKSWKRVGEKKRQADITGSRVEAGDENLPTAKSFKASI